MSDQSVRTIADFGEQWSRYTDNSGFYGSDELFADIVEPLVPVSELRGKEVLEVGSGTGRIVRMLLQAGARKVTALEPSAAAFEVLGEAFAGDARVELVKATGDRVSGDSRYDVALAIGVLHHIPDPRPVVCAVLRALRPEGRFIVWLYGFEGNEAYVTVAGGLRLVTTRLPHALLVAVVWVAYAALRAYGAAARRLPVPMRDYVLNVIGRMSPDKQRLVIYDQLNPRFAKYYRRAEAEALLSDAGFSDVRSHHRHGYSWTVVGRKPDASGGA